MSVIPFVVYRTNSLTICNLWRINLLRDLNHHPGFFTHLADAKYHILCLLRINMPRKLETGVRCGIHPYIMGAHESD